MVFPEAELERLTESISEAGVLVPIVVYEDGDHYNLIDGERRWRCSYTLGLATIPALLVDRPDEITRLTHMFNIHLVREPWQDMPTAWALEQYVEATGVDDDRNLADRLGLSIERVQRLRHALELPKEYQAYIFEGVIPLNFFWELKRNVIDPLARLRPILHDEFGREGLLSAFVQKRLAGGVPDVVSLRKVRPIIKAAHLDSEEGGVAEGPFDQVLRDLIARKDATIDDAYQETIASEIEFAKLGRRIDTTVKAFERAYLRASSGEQKTAVRAAIQELTRRLLTIGN